jgi:hypothetical protein
MRVAVIVVTMLAMTTPSEASQSCMSKTEARQHFGLAHIYWHGADHCWDASASRHRQIQTLQIHALQIQARQKPLIPEVEPKSEPKWHDSMSAMLPDDEAVQLLRTPASLDVERQSGDAVIATSWADRWVDIGPSQSSLAPLVARRVRVVQVSPSPVIERKSALMVFAHDILLLAFIVFLLTLGTVGAVYRRDL